MSWRRQGLRVLLGCGVLLLSALVVLDGAGPARSQTKKKKGTGTGPYLNNLTNWFQSADLDGDGYLDKDELARAFRGPGAKAYDSKAADKDNKDDDSSTAAKGKVRPTSVALVCLPQPGMAANLAIAEVLTLPTEKKPAKKKDGPTNYTSLPDYQFLTQLDTDGDKKVSRAEFDVWARSYASQLKAQNDLQKSIADTQRKLANANNRTRTQLQNDLRRQQQELDRLNRQLNQAYARALRGQ